MTDDLPTPPLPEATAYTRVSEPARANGTSRSATPPRSMVFSSPRCSSLITPRVTVTPVTPSTAARAAVVSLVRVSLSGQAATVSRMVTATWPPSSAATLSTMPSSVTGLRISGSMTVSSAAWRASGLTWGMAPV